MVAKKALRARQKLGKYRIEKRLAEGGFAAVYQAYDTIEGIRVALKVPHVSFENRENLDLFRREVRLTARLDHPHILRIKDASFIDDRFVIASPLAERSLSDRLQSRLAVETSISYTEQLLDALAYAHGQGILHCDLKPDNVLLFPSGQLRLADFGIARVARRTVQASGSGTLGSMAPEQAMGRPSLRSDVFALGLIIFRLFTGKTPEWPFRWPLPGHERLLEKLPVEAIGWLRKSLEVEPARRYRDAVEMRNKFRELRPAIDRFLELRRRRRRKKTASGSKKASASPSLRRKGRSR